MNPRKAAGLSDAMLEAIIDFGVKCEELGGWPDEVTDRSWSCSRSHQGASAPSGFSAGSRASGAESASQIRGGGAPRSTRG